MDILQVFMITFKKYFDTIFELFAVFYTTLFP